MSLAQAVPAEMGAAPTVSDGEIAFLYAAVHRAVERSSIRDVARQSGMGHGGTTSSRGLRIALAGDDS